MARAPPGTAPQHATARQTATTTTSPRMIPRSGMTPEVARLHLQGTQSPTAASQARAAPGPLTATAAGPPSSIQNGTACRSFVPQAAIAYQVNSAPRTAYSRLPATIMHEELNGRITLYYDDHVGDCGRTRGRWWFYKCCCGTFAACPPGYGTPGWPQYAVTHCPVCRKFICDICSDVQTLLSDFVKPIHKEYRQPLTPFGLVAAAVPAPSEKTTEASGISPTAALARLQERHKAHNEEVARAGYPISHGTQIITTANRDMRTSSPHAMGADASTRNGHPAGVTASAAGPLHRHRPEQPSSSPRKSVAPVTKSNGHVAARNKTGVHIPTSSSTQAGGRSDTSDWPTMRAPHGDRPASLLEKYELDRQIARLGEHQRRVMNPGSINRRASEEGVIAVSDEDDSEKMEE